MADDGEVYFCGHCNRQQPAVPGKEKCRDCGRITVSWYTNKEKVEAAIRRWKSVHG